MAYVHPEGNRDKPKHSKVHLCTKVTYQKNLKFSYNTAHNILVVKTINKLKQPESMVYVPFCNNLLGQTLVEAVTFKDL